MAFLTELATNATKHNIPIVIYSGNDDAIVPHRGSEGLCEEFFFTKSHIV
jgi:carboxypeptidase D